jgi:hypothetical protein
MTSRPWPDVEVARGLFEDGEPSSDAFRSGRSVPRIAAFLAATSQAASRAISPSGTTRKRVLGQF